MKVTVKIPARYKSAEKSLGANDIGRMIEGEGIYLGRYRLLSLGKVFNVFAAPEDLPGTRTYLHTVEYMSGLKNWHGFDGTSYANDIEIRVALMDGSYNGGWIIPPRELVCGVDVNGQLVQSDHLLAHHATGAFNGTFELQDLLMPTSSRGNGYPGKYLSSTEDPEKKFRQALVWVTRFKDGGHIAGAAHMNSYACRPVRLVEIKP